MSKTIQVSDELYAQLERQAQTQHCTIEHVLENHLSAHNEPCAGNLLNQLFVNNEAVQLLIHADTGQIEDASDAAVDFYGYPREQLLSMNINEINTLTPEQTKIEMERARLNQQSFFRFKHRLANGYIRDVAVFSGRVRINGHDQLYSFIFDTTSEMRYRAALQEQKNRLEITLEGAKLGTWDWHVPTSTVRFNREWAEMLGHEPWEISTLLDEWSSRVHPDDWTFITPALNDHLEGRTPYYQTEHRMRHKDGSWRWVLDRGMVIERDENNKPLRATGIHLDITAQKEAQKQRLELESEQERIKVMRQFITDASHEFYTPLSIINSSTFLLEYNDTLSENGHQHLCKIRQASEDVQRLVKMLNELVRLESETPKLSLSCQVSDIIYNALDDIKPLMDDKKQSFTIMMSTRPPCIATHEDDLTFAVAELLRNAWMYSPVGSNIDILVETAADTIDISIRDNGVGIAANDFPFIFNRFFRGDKAHTTRGFGLGLCIVERVVTHHGGTISVDSQVEEGTTVIMHLPIRKDSGASSENENTPPVYRNR